MAWAPPAADAWLPAQVLLAYLPCCPLLSHNQQQLMLLPLSASSCPWHLL
jgi:hypothetical protein